MNTESCSRNSETYISALHAAAPCVTLGPSGPLCTGGLMGLGHGFYSSCLQGAYGRL